MEPWLNELKPLKLESYERLEKSVVRDGFDVVKPTVSNLSQFQQQQDLHSVINFLSCT